MSKKTKPKIDSGLIQRMEKERKETKAALITAEPKKVEMFKCGGRTKTIRLEYLEEGRAFEIVGCEKIFRNLFVKRISQSSVLIGGEKQEDKDVWVNLGVSYYVAPATEVIGL